MTLFPDTVRGWLQAIHARLTNQTEQAAILAEIQYLNQRLWGSDSVGGTLAAPNQPPLYDALIRPIDGASGPNERMGLLEYLVRRLDAVSEPTLTVALLNLATGLSTLQDGLNDEQGVTVGERLNTIRILLGNIQATTRSTVANTSTADLLYQIRTLVSTTYPPPIDSDVIQLLAGIGSNTLRQADCCESVGDGETGGPLNPFPEEQSSICDWEGVWYRVQGWINLTLDPGEPEGQKLWGAILPWGGNGIIGNRLNHSAPVWLTTAPQGTDLEFCWAWNFTGVDKPYDVGFDYGCSLEEADTRSGTSQPTEVIPIGTTSATITTCSGLFTNTYIAPRMRMNSVHQPTLNVWYKVRIAPQ